MRAKLTKLITDYEYELIASTGKFKKEYIGLVGCLELKRNFVRTSGSYVDLYDLTFPDGAMFCVELEQIEILEE